MALHIVPTNTPNTDDQVKNTDYAPAAPCASGVTDTLRSNGPIQVATMINNRHPIESRILNWDKTQYAMQMETRRRVHGLADPIKREMDLHMVQLIFSGVLTKIPFNTNKRTGCYRIIAAYFIPSLSFQHQHELQHELQQ
ncbi:hypothetical protein JL09_g1807 [Pichia kudriavzevii]|uniref:Uncharacterized protein n=1 Tax=Pichia kudriavzevii TaxID=4909 RepID=A0A099P406_PICKU|nr:hypothetical protein JL09_g1807 [Pichia kudriavzevii]